VANYRGDYLYIPSGMLALVMDRATGTLLEDRNSVGVTFAEDVFRFDFRFKKSAWKRQRNYSHTMTAEIMFSGFRDITTLSIFRRGFPLITTY
jgi:hypothetical protein